MNLDVRLLRQARAARFALSATLALGLLGGVLLVFQARAISGVIARVFLEDQGLEEVTPLLLLLLGILLGRAATTLLAEVSAGAAAVRVKSSLREMLARKLFALGPAYNQGERSGELSAVLLEGVEALDAYFSQYLPQLALAALVPLVILLAVFPLDALSGVVLLVTAPLIPLFMVLIGKAAEAVTGRQWNALRRMSAYFLDTLQGLATLKALNRSREEAQQVAAMSERYRRVTLEVLRVTFLSALALELTATISTAIVAVEIGLRLLYGRMVFEQAFFVLLLAPEFYLPLRTFGARFHSGMAGVTAARRIFEVLEAPEPKANGGGVSAPAGRVKLTGAKLEFCAVSFTYPARQLAALHEVSFAILPGQHLALVGASGSGKSTIAQLLLRFIEPDGGAILVDGRPARSMDLEEWRAQLAWAPQQPYLFRASLAENIRLGKPGASIEEVRRAAMQAGIAGWIEALPQGYATQAGEQGARLSGGQAQRIALARAFLKDAPLLVMDEPSAHIDPQQEAALQETIARLRQRRTVVTIAHRLATVAQADRILVLEAGRVAEAGRHSELLARRGLYYRLATAYVGRPER